MFKGRRGMASEIRQREDLRQYHGGQNDAEAGKLFLLFPRIEARPQDFMGRQRQRRTILPRTLSLRTPRRRAKQLGYEAETQKGVYAASDWIGSDRLKHGNKPYWAGIQ